GDAAGEVILCLDATGRNRKKRECNRSAAELAHLRLQREFEPMLLPRSIPSIRNYWTLAPRLGCKWTARRMAGPRRVQARHVIEGSPEGGRSCDGARPTANVPATSSNARIHAASVAKLFMCKVSTFAPLAPCV